MMWIIYELLLFIGLLLYIPKALWRRRLPHRGWRMRLGWYPAAVRERLGQGRAAPPPVFQPKGLTGPPSTDSTSGGAIWIHAVSVGEVLAVQPVVRKLRVEHPGSTLVLSTVTPAGFQVASRLMGKQGVAIYGPLDFRVTVERALRAIQPRLLLLVESELWPNFIRLAKRQRVPIAVVNGRVSARASRRHLRVKHRLADVLADVDLFLMQTEVDAQRILEVGVSPSRVKVLGSLKWDASLVARPAEPELAALTTRLGFEPGEALIVAGSTHRGEEAALLQAFQAVRAELTHARLLIAPRHLERVGEVEELIRKQGMQAERVSRLAGSPPSWDVAIVDAIGQLPLYYALASVVFVGGSLIPHGGQNPIEPASLGKPVLFGPSMENFAEIANQLLTHRAARQLHDGHELASVLQGLLSDREEASCMGARGQALVERLSGTTHRTLEALKPLLEN